MGEEEERRGIESRVVGGLSRFVARSSKWDVLSYMDQFSSFLLLFTLTRSVEHHATGSMAMKKIR